MTKAKQSIATPLTRVVLLACSVLMLNGCVGYQLGSMLPKDIRTVKVGAVINNTEEPLIEVDITRALIEKIQTDGSLRVVNDDSADAVLDVTMNRYAIVPLAYNEDTKTQAEEYRIIMDATVVLTRAKTGERVVSTNVRGKTTFPFQSDLTTAKRTALPDAAKDLAHQIVESIVEFWNVPAPAVTL